MVASSLALVDDDTGARPMPRAFQSNDGETSRLTVPEWIALSLTHELNQPLAAIANYLRASQRLLADQQAADGGRLAAALDGAMMQAQHAGRVISSLRAFVTSGASDKRVEPLAALIDRAVALTAPDTEQYGIHVSVVLDPAAALVLADCVQIEQVLVNLIRNAAQAMRASPRRLLTIASRRCDGSVEVSIADSGCGVPEVVRPHLFEPFMTTRRDGTGLGLMICRALVEAHGGAIAYEPAPGGGSLFRFSLTGMADTPP